MVLSHLLRTELSRALCGCALAAILCVSCGEAIAQNINAVTVTTKPGGNLPAGPSAPSFAVAPDCRSVAVVVPIRVDGIITNSLINIYDLESRKLLDSISNGSPNMGTLAFSGDARKLMFIQGNSAQVDVAGGTLYVYDRQRRKNAATIRNVFRPTYSRDAKWICDIGAKTVSDAPVVHIVSIPTGARKSFPFSKRSPGSVAYAIEDAALSSDGHQLAVATLTETQSTVTTGVKKSITRQKYGDVRLFNPATLTEKTIASAEPKPGNQWLFVKEVAFSPDGSKLAVCRPMEVAVWDLNRESLLWKTTVRTSATKHAIAFSPDSLTLAILGDWNGRGKARWVPSVQLRNVIGGVVERALPLTAAADAVQFSLDGRRIMTLKDKQAQVTIWDARNGKSVNVISFADLVARAGVAATTDAATSLYSPTPPSLKTSAPAPEAH